MKPSLFCYLIISCVLITSCKKDNLKAPEASFLVANPSLITNPSTQGSNTHKITDMWLYVNNQFQGCFAAGQIMPIVASGSANVKLFAGIKNNGIADTRQPYFFYKSVEYNLSIEAGKTYTVNPAFEYISSANFAFTDNFDNGSFFIPSQNAADSTIEFRSLNAFGGSGKSVFMSMSDAKPVSLMVTAGYHFVPLSGDAVYLEMDYKCNQDITVGVISGTEQRFVIGLNPTTGWNKIYIDLRTAINTQPTSNFCKFYITATKATATPEIYIDNVKVITE